MKIAFIGMYYYPEKFSSRYLIKDIVDCLRKDGHDVTIIVPNPVRKMSKEEILKYREFKEEGIERLWIGKGNGDSLLFRLNRIFKFNNKLKKYLSKHHDYDCLIMQSNPPIFSSLAIEKCAKKYGIKTIFYVDDIFPDILNKNNLALKYLKHLSRKSYLNADSIVTISEDVKNTLLEKGVSDKKINIISPWFFESEEAPKRTFKFPENKFNISYIGNVGNFQNCRFILEVAKNIKNKNIYFYIIGSGREEKSIKKLIKKDKINNVKFVDRVDEGEAKILYSESSLNLIVLNRNIINFAMPSKTVNCVLSGKPCLLLCDKSIYSSELVNKYHFYFDDSFDAKIVSEKINKIFDYYEPNRCMKNTDVIDFNKEKQLQKWKNIVKNQLAALSNQYLK